MMGFSPFLLCFLFLFTVSAFSKNQELTALMDLKASLDPENRLLSSWPDSGSGLGLGRHPCDGSFEGVACDGMGQVANISLQGKGLSGKLSPAIGRFSHLTGLYLHYNALFGEIPREISSLSELTDLYLNVNNLSGEIPPELGNLANLQVLQLCYNQFTGSIPTKLGSMKKLNVLALQFNKLTGAIPASLGDVGLLMRLDLSFNRLFGSIPSALADAPLLQVLDVRNNTLSGNVSPALKRLGGGFYYENNLDLCGDGFSSLMVCSALDHPNLNGPKPYGEDSTGFPRKEIPETAYLKLNCSQTPCSKSSKASLASVIVGVVIVVTVIVSAFVILTLARFRRLRQRHGSTNDASENCPSIDQVNKPQLKNGSPLLNLEYSSGWDPLAEDRRFGEVMQGFRFVYEELESATSYFAEKNLLGRSNLAAVYKGTLRNGTMVAIKSISKTSCKSEESEFVKGLNTLTSLTNENIVSLRGFCCSRGRKECFLVYDFVPNGSLLRYLDAQEGSVHALEWSSRVSIINGIARGIDYLHGCRVNKHALVHQNISAKNVLLDQHNQPLLSDSGLHKLLTNDSIFSSLKASAAMGYLAPEYTTTGRFTEKSDIYAFGVLMLQILSGVQKISSPKQSAAELGNMDDFIDSNLRGNYSELEALKLVKVALKCTNESPEERPDLETVIQELSCCTDFS